MLRFTPLLPAALALLLAAPAVAQTAPPNAGATPQPATSASGFLAQQTPDEWRGSKLIGTSVYGPDGKSIGGINELIVETKGDVRAVVIGVGGFLGIGEKNIAVPFQALHITRKPNTSSVERITIGVTKDELQKAPKFGFLKANGANNTTASGGHAATETGAPAQR